MDYCYRADAHAAQAAGLVAFVPPDESAVAPPGRPPAPSREAVVTRWGAAWSHAPSWTTSPWEAAVRQLGLRLPELMLDDDKVGGSVGVLKESILSDGIQVSPVVTPDEGDGQGDARGEARAGRRSREITTFVRRALDRLALETPLEEVVEQLLDACVYQSMLAEKVTEDIRSGSLAGKRVLKRVAVKPRGAWRYVVNPQGRATGILAETEDGPRVLSPDRFAILSWMPEKGDPTGTTVLRQAYLAWNTKIQLFPKYYKYLSRFAEPSLVGTCGQDAKPRQPRKADGSIDADAPPLDPVADLANELSLFESGSIIALPYGSVVSALEIAGQGEAFLTAFDLLDRYIVFAILHQTRATMEAQHGSKADSATASDILDQFARKQRLAVGRMVRRSLLYPMVRDNFGEDDALLYTPRVQLGNLDYLDLARFVNAISKLCETGYLAESQLPSLDEMMKLPIRKPGSARVTSTPAAQGPQGVAGGRPTATKPPTSKPAAPPKGTP